MYNKYNSVSPITPGITKLGAHKALLVAPTGATAALTGWYLDSGYGITGTIGLTFGSVNSVMPQILPIQLYAVTIATGCNVYRLN
jgi:hypothetical protein